MWTVSASVILLLVKVVNLIQAILRIEPTNPLLTPNPIYPSSQTRTLPPPLHAHLRGQGAISLLVSTLPSIQYPLLPMFESKRVSILVLIIP